MTTKGLDLCVALYPNGSGLGYVVCENPKELVAYGMGRIRPMTTPAYLKRLMHFVELYRPSLIVLRGWQGKTVKASPRVRKILQCFTKRAHELGLEVHHYTREDIKASFSKFGDPTKYGISKTIAGWYPELRSRMPDPRRNTKAEHWQMGIFDAFALMLTHFYLE